MAKRKVVISGLHRGEKFGISTLDKILLCKLWGKVWIQQQEDARPGEADVQGQKIPL